LPWPIRDRVSRPHRSIGCCARSSAAVEARSGSNGAGLGLPIVERIARLHGGALRLLANAPHGLRAELSLPGARVANR
jgi:two-component system, OmpR family, osmolarity sensor histidine kinase EnvZ